MALQDEIPNRSWGRPATQTLSDHVARAILESIAAGQIQPGDRLPPQRALAQTFDVGMSVIREAIQRLEALHVVDAEPGSGTTIRPFRWLPLIYDPSLFQMAVERIGIADLWEARRLLEGQIVHLAVQRATDADLAAIEDVLRQAEAGPDDYDCHHILNREFHLALARAAKNQVLEDLVAPLLDIRFGGVVGHRFSKPRSEGAWEAHRRIFDALVARDVAAIEAAIVHHFEEWPPLVIAETEVEERSA